MASELVADVVFDMSFAVDSVKIDHVPRSHGCVVGLLVALSILAACTGSPTHKSIPIKTTKAVATVPQPDYAALVPSTFRIVSVQQVDMDGGPIPQEVVSAAGPNVTGTGAGQSRVLVLAYDIYAKRWTTVFDSHTPQAADLPGLIDGEYGVTGLTVTPIRSRPDGTTDLLIAGNAVVNDGQDLELGIVSYTANQSKLEYSFTSETNGTARVVGTGSTQRVAVSTGYYSALDAHCCPSRIWHFAIGPKRDSFGDRYGVVADNRPWLGLNIQLGNSGQIDGATVAKVYANSPAASLGLHRGDVITGMVDGAAKPVADESMVNAIARLLPGAHVELQIFTVTGTRRTVAVTIGSQLGHPLDGSGESALGFLDV